MLRVLLFTLLLHPRLYWRGWLIHSSNNVSKVQIQKNVSMSDSQKIILCQTNLQPNNQKTCHIALFPLYGWGIDGGKGCLKIYFIFISIQRVFGLSEFWMEEKPDIVLFLDFWRFLSDLPNIFFLFTPLSGKLTIVRVRGQKRRKCS